jgi:hypothetical protein
MSYEIHLSIDDILDITRRRNGSGKVTHVVVNYRARFQETGDEWHEIYRIDNSHGYLHEQRFWIGPDPIRLEIGHRTLLDMVHETIEKLKKNHMQYKQKFRMKLVSEGKIKGEREGRKRKYGGAKERK